MAGIKNFIVHGKCQQGVIVRPQNALAHDVGFAAQNSIAQDLRQTWPIIKAGPVTTAQRLLANAAADQIESAQQMIDSIATALSVAKQRIAALEAENRALKAAHEPKEPEHPLHRAIRQGAK